MRAMVLKGYGDADQFEVREMPDPQPGAGELRVRVRAIGINPMDARIRSGAMKDEMEMSFPAILGSDVAGEVDEIGSGATGFSVGDRVVGLASSGSYAEFAIVRSNNVTAIVGDLSFEQAATIPTAAEAATRGIGLLDVKPGETVVVNGASGSVGAAAVQMLVQAGAKVVGTASESSLDFVRDLGAEATPYGDGVEDRIRELAPEGVDAVFDVSNHGFVDTAITLRGGSDRIVTLSEFTAGSKGVTVTLGEADKIRSSEYEPAVKDAADGRFRTDVAKVFPFDDIPSSHELVEGEHGPGKIIVEGP